MALVTVMSTEGSSYSKAGQQLLIDDCGEAQGLLSGGCLEGDLTERCANAIATGAPAAVEYDLNSDDELFGLGVGCDGVMRIQILPLSPATGYEPLSSIVRALDEKKFVDIEVFHEQGVAKFRWIPPPRILLLGAGPDVDPLFEICSTLGWALSVSDHRPAYVARLEHCDAANAVCTPIDDVGAAFDLSRYDAAIVMSHNLSADRSYLRQLSESDIEFIGLLGPPHRKERLLTGLGDQASSLQNRLRSPVGIEIGGRGPAAIALEIAVELQAYFCAADQRLSSASRSDSESISIDAGSKLTAITH